MMIMMIKDRLSLTKDCCEGRSNGDGGGGRCKDDDRLAADQNSEYRIPCHVSPSSTLDRAPP